MGKPRLCAAAALFLAALAVAPRAGADRLSVAETQELLRGAPVVRKAEVERGGRRYVGGVSYAVVDATPDRVTRLLEDVATWQRILPRTRSARLVGFEGNDPLVLLTQGTPLLQASYTIRVHRDGPELRFWLVPTKSHDIEDAWGFLRVEPLDRGQTVVSYGILVDLGPGLVRDLFEERVRDLALSVPERVRGLVLEQAAAGKRASR